MVSDWQVLLPFNPCCNAWYDDECEVSELKFAYISKSCGLGHEHEKRKFVLRTSGLQRRVGRSRPFFFLSGGKNDPPEKHQDLTFFAAKFWKKYFQLFKKINK